MQCPQCQTENQEGRRFCGKCGAPLAVTCPDCGFANEPRVDFCGGCGKEITTNAVPPPDRAPTRETGEPERRQLTVMFCDLVGSTALAERLDPEELHQVLAQYQDICAEVIHHYDGYIARYVGDGLLVYFGYPKAHEDDAQRGVRAGLGIVEAIEQLDSKIEKSNINLAVRIGIATGLVVAGDIGRGERVEQNAIVGETPNLAARLQALAEPNTVVIGASTQRLVDGLFGCDDFGAQDLKGISQAVNVYRVRAEGGAPSRFEAAAQRGLTPLVGRESEISLLLSRWEQAKDREGQVVLLSGEAGIGKSRIVRGFRERLEAEPHSRVLYYGSPYHQNSALYPAIDQLERGLRFEKGDSATRKLDKLEEVLNDLDMSVSDFTPVLAFLLSLSLDGRYPPLELSPEQLKKKTLGALVAVIGAIARRQPVLMVIEDLQWIDPSTLELVDVLVQQLQGTRLLLVVTFRPEFKSHWDHHARATFLTLNRLSRKESVALITKVVGNKMLPEAIVDEIVTKTDGVPLFVEELTKTVLESDLLEDAGDRYDMLGALPSIAIPASLQDSLMARLDRLGSVKDAAQLAATLGRTFSRELFSAVSPLKGSKLDDALSKLVAAELIYPRGLAAGIIYEFKHALVQDAAYQSLLKSTRQRYHRQIAGVLEEHFPETLTTQPELLAHHYAEGCLPEEAIRYWQKASERASERSANLEAIAHLTKGLELLRSLPDTPDRVRKEVTLQIGLGVAWMAAKSFGAPEVKQAYRRAAELCQEVGDSPQLFRALWGLGRFYMSSGQLQKGRELADQLLALAERLRDSGLLIEAHLAMGGALLWVGEFTPARAHMDDVIALYDSERHHPLSSEYGEDPRVVARDRGAVALWMLGYPDQALRTSLEALALAQKPFHPFSLGRALAFAARIHWLRREAPAAQERSEAAIQLCTEYGFPLWLNWGIVFRDWALTELGNTESEITQLQQDVVATLRIQIVAQTSFLALLAEACGKLGQLDQGLRALAEAEAVRDRTGERWWEAELLRLRGELSLKQGAAEVEAETCFTQAIDIARRQHAKSLELRACTRLSRLWQKQSKRSEAHDLLAPVYSWFTEGFDTADLKEAKALLDELV